MLATGGRTGVHVVRISLIVARAAAAGVIGTSTTALIAAPVAILVGPVPVVLGIRFIQSFFQVRQVAVLIQAPELDIVPHRYGMATKPISLDLLIRGHIASPIGPVSTLLELHEAFVVLRGRHIVRFA